MQRAPKIMCAVCVSCPTIEGMPEKTKIATCSYCGTRTLMTLAEGKRYELVCSTCGAPLHDMQMLKNMASGDTKSPISNSSQESPFRMQALLPVFLRKRGDEKPEYKQHKKYDKRRRKKRRGLCFWVKEAIDEIEDEIEDIFD